MKLEDMDFENLDWTYIINSIRANHASCASISRQIRCDPQKLRKLSRGEEVKTSFKEAVRIGANLLNLYNRHCEGE